MLKTIAFAICLSLLPTSLVFASDDSIPVPNMVTMVDLGAKSCIPCKMMAPILEKLTAEYEGKAAIRFIDVWENPDKGKVYGIRAIPTQIFYDKQGKERERHEGFMDEKQIRQRVDALMAE